MDVHLQRDERDQEAVRDQEPARHALEPASREHLRGEKRRHTHEAVSENVHRVEKRVEGREQERFDALRASRGDARSYPGELHVVVNADQDGVDRRERNRAMAPDLSIRGRDVVNTDHEHEKRGPEE